jgi:hypothetical protein
MYDYNFLHIGSEIIVYDYNHTYSHLGLVVIDFFVAKDIISFSDPWALPIIRHEVNSLMNLNIC